MCGINSIFAYHHAASPIDGAELERTRDHMAARGPDGHGKWLSEDGRVGLGHRRLAIIDLSFSGAQPMVSADGSLVITFNGEIYNYKALRAELEAEGAHFASHSDTEVLLHLYARRGAGMIEALRGMFAFAIWDARQRSLFLARDPYGIKPLYYADDGRTIRVASQVKALMAGGRIAGAPDPAGIAGFYLWGSVPEPYTTYRAIRALPAGTHMTVDACGVHAPNRFHSIAGAYAEAEVQAQARKAPERAGEIIREALRDSVRHHMVADVPVGAFLSAGIDSGALVGLMRDAGQADIQTVTLSFEEFSGGRHDEAPLAAEVARLYGTRHTNRVVTEAEFRTDLPLILSAMDQPSIDGINTWFVSKAAHELGLKVVVSGLGGDELFGGYASFRDIPRLVSTIAPPGAVPGSGRAWRHLAETWAALTGTGSPKFSSLVELGGSYAGAYLLRRGVFMPHEIARLLGPELAREGLEALRPLAGAEALIADGPHGPFARVAMLEAALYMRNQLLRDSDWASMAHSLELRVPLVDSHLLAAVAPFTVAPQGRVGKMVLAAAPSTPLPDSIVHRRKTGFSTPIADWLKQGWPPPARPKAPASLMRPTCPWARRWAWCVAPAAL
ncbi:MAG: asparagine synthase (glutamine-hydrolyzing) [Rhodomicrobium sp.]